LSQIKTRGGKMAEAKILKIDAKPFIKFCEELASKLPTSMSVIDVFEQETMSVLRTCGKKIKRSSKAKAGGKFNPRSRNFTGWVRMNGKMYYVGPTKGKYKGFKYSPSMWNKLQDRMKAVRKRAETRVGLSKAVFYRVGRLLKLDGYGSGWSDSGEIKTALEKSGGIGSSGRSGPIWSSKKVSSTKKNLKGKNPTLQFTISSTNTFNPTTGNTGVVQSSFRGRVKYFEEGVKNGLLESTENIARNYPNIKIAK